MCDPVSLSIGAMALTGAGAIQQSNSARAAGRANQQYYDYQSEQNKQAATAAEKVGDQRVNIAQTKGAMDSAKYARNSSEFNAMQTASAAAMGGSGGATTEDISRDSLNKQQLDQQAIRYNADMEAWNAKTGAAYQAWDYRNQSNLNTFSGINARKAGNASGTASLIGGATSIANLGYQQSRYSVPMGGQRIAGTT